MVILGNRKYAQITFYCGAELFKASYISKQLFNALYAAFESCVHGALKVATPTVLGVRARGNNTSPHRRCLPLTGSEENATMLNPTVRENLLFPSSSPSARRPRRFPQVQSMVAYEANYLRIYKGRVFGTIKDIAIILSLFYIVRSYDY